MIRRVPIAIVAAALLAAGTAAAFPASASKTVAASQTLTLTPGETLTVRCPTPHESWNRSGYPLAVTCPGGTTTTTAPPVVTRTVAPTTTTPPVTTTAPAPSTSTTRPVTTTTVPGSVSRLFGPTSLWNTVKEPTAFATEANSVIQGINFGLNNGAYDHPLYIAKATDPLTTFHLGAGWGNPAVTIVATAPSGMVQASGGDADMDVLLTGGTAEAALKLWPAGTLPWANTLLDMYGVTGSGTDWTAAYYGVSDGVDGPGFSYGLGYTIGTTAIGSPQAGGTVLASDVAAGVIPHGLTMACDYDYEGGVGTSNSDQIAPAVSNDDGGGPGPLPEGGLLLIPPGTSMPSGLSPMGKQLWDAAATYGVYITDQAGGGCYFYGDGSSAVGNAFTSTDLNDVGHALELVVTW